MFVVIFLKTMYNKAITRFSFCDILDYQGLGKCYQPLPSAQLITRATVIIPDITKTSSNNCSLSGTYSAVIAAERPQGASSNIIRI